MKNIRLDYAKETIEITKAFEKKASVYGSLAYNELATVRRDFPTFKLKISESKGSNGFKGMDYDFMRNYISIHDTSDCFGDFQDRLRLFPPLSNQVISAHHFCCFSRK